MSAQAGLQQCHDSPGHSPQPVPQSGIPSGTVAGAPLPAQDDQVQAELIKIRNELLLLQQENARWKAEEVESRRWQATQIDDEDMESQNNNEVDEELKKLSWTSVLKPVEVVGLCSLLAAPPPLEQLRLSEKDCPSFSKVPKTPVPRKQNRTDINLFQVQKKVEGAMNMLVHCADSGDQRSLHVQAAMLRLAWEDLL